MLHMRAMLSRKAMLLLLVGAVLCMVSISTPAQTWSKGEVFAGIANGQYNVYTNTGTLVQTLTDNAHSGYTTGCRFNNDLTKLYTTNFSQDLVEIYDGNAPHNLLSTIDTSSAGSSNESLVFDKSGNFYVGHADGAHGIIKYSASGTALATFFPATEDRGTDWIDLAADQKTLFYTSEGLHVKRFDVSANTQLPDFATVSNTAYAIRLLPPYDGSTGLLVAATSEILRLDKNGVVLQTYNVAGSGLWFSLNLDPNGTSFWSGDLDTGKLYRFNISTGAVEVGPIDTTSATGGTLGGVCVRGELSSTADTTPPVVTLTNIITGPPKQVQITSYDTQSGLGSIVVTNCTNCTATTQAFTVGTNNKVVTTATKTNQSLGSTIQLKVTDVAGNVTLYDPVDVNIESSSKPSTHTVAISAAEHILLIANGTPGIEKLYLNINGRPLHPIKLDDGQGLRLDLMRYLSPLAQNKVTIRSTGASGATAWLVFTQP